MGKAVPLVGMRGAVGRGRTEQVDSHCRQSKVLDPWW